MIKKIRYRLVWNRANKLNARNEGLIQIECEQQGRKIYFSTHTYAKTGQFADGIISGIDNAEGLNYVLYKMIQELESIELEYIKRGVNVNLAMLKDAYNSHISPAAKITDFGVEVVNQSERKNLTKLNYKTLFNNLEKFRKGILITDIDYPFLMTYDKWLREGGISHNTRISRLRMLRALLNEAKKRDIITSNPFDRFRIQQMVSKKGYITKEELHRLEKLNLKGYDEKVRDAFLIGCYTGLRFSDIVSLRNTDISDGWLEKKMQKTGFMVQIPIRELFGGKMVAMIEKYSGNIETLTKSLGLNSTVNRKLREILDGLDVDAKITFHSSRHTFATLLGQQGIDITAIQKLLGHTKITTTQIYSEVDKTTIITRLRKNGNGKNHFIG